MNKTRVLQGLGALLGCVALGCYAINGDAGVAETQVYDGHCQSITMSDPDGPGPLPAGLPRLAGNLVVDMADDMTPAQLQDWQRRYGVELQYNSPYAKDSNLMVAEVDEGRMPELLSSLQGDSQVESIEPNYIWYGFDTQLEEGALSSAEDDKEVQSRRYPNDPLYKHQWHMDMIGAPSAWKYSQGRGAVVAVVDTGVAWKDSEGFVAVEDLAQTRIVPGYDFVNRNELALDDNAHGTHVAGTIAQSTNNPIGVAGVAPQAAIMPVKVLSGRGMGTISNIADGIRFASKHGANVINMSLGGPMPSKAIANAVTYADAHGTLVCCAAGNDGRDTVSYPAGYPESLAVSALDAKGEMAWYSNHGQRVDIAAPGGDARSDDNGDGVPDGVYQNTIAMGDPTHQGYYAFQGTSMACPHVAGAAAVLVGQGITSPQALKKALGDSAVSKGRNSRLQGFGSGALNVGKAAFRVGFMYGSYRLLLALLVALAAGAFSWRRSWKARLATLPGLLMGASGLFFLPLFCLTPSEWSWLSLPIPAWDTVFMGAGVHGNPLVCSCLIPALLSLLVTHTKIGRYLLAGLTLGWAGYLFWEMWTGATLLLWIPGSLAWLWWLANGLFCVCLAQVLMEHAIESRVK